MLVGCDFEFFVENVSQNFSKIYPVVDDAVLDRVAEFKVGSIFYSDINVFIVQVFIFLFGSPNYGLERGSWSLVS